MDRLDPHHASTPTLSPDDARVLDALLETGGADAARLEATVAALPPGDAQRARRQVEWLHLIGQCPAGAPPLDLTQRTLARVADAQREEALLEKAQGPALPWRGMRLTELAAMAAMLIVAVSILWPVMARMRSDARRFACSNNLLMTGDALGAFAADHGGLMPRQEGWEPGMVWNIVGQDAEPERPVESNSANFYRLVRQSYASPATLNCPENPDALRNMTPAMRDWPRDAARSYSYQNQSVPGGTRLEQFAQRAVLADRNPLLGDLAGRRVSQPVAVAMDPTSSSQFHRHQGQNVLMGDGHVVWTTVPVLPDGDNFWLINNVYQYQGTEFPTGPGDAFLTP